tara:strand:+ start:128 stop:466 length:339 start_codon:yes stop_codon:yes gene_type:complete
MKKLITIAAGLLLTGSVFASTVTLHKNTQLVTADYASKSEAIDAAFDISEALKADTRNELRKELNISSHAFARDITVDQTEITAEEFAASRDEIQYRAIVKVSYHFETEEQD